MKNTAIIEDVKFQISLKGYAELIVDCKQKNGLRKNAIESLQNQFNVIRVPNVNFIVFKITNK